MGVLNGFDRIRFRGTQRWLANERGMMGFLWKRQGKLKHFKPYALKLTAELRESIERLAETSGRPSLYLYSSALSKEDLARQIARDDHIDEGLIGVLRCGEPMHYYWSADDTEWASDLRFRSPQRLARLYPQLLQHGMRTFSSGDVLRFLGRKVPAHGQVHAKFTGEVLTDLRRRAQVSQAANDRYLDALSAVEETTPLGTLAAR